MYYNGCSKFFCQNFKGGIWMVHVKKISSMLFLVSLCFLIGGCTEKNPEQQVQGESSIENQNIEAVQSVLKAEFTVPNEDHLEVVQNIEQKMREIDSNTSETDEAKRNEELGNSDEWRAYEELVEKTYGAYFTESEFDKLIPTNAAFRYHQEPLSFDKDNQYEITIDDMDVVKSDNPNTPKSYNFTVQVTYENSANEASQHEIKGTAILSEPGEIGKFELKEDGGLYEKVQANQY